MSCHSSGPGWSAKSSNEPFVRSRTNFWNWSQLPAEMLSSVCSAFVTVRGCAAAARTSRSPSTSQTTPRRSAT
eukprot:8510684-Pyramimonas_sp.AAC.1